MDDKLFFSGEKQLLGQKQALNLLTRSVSSGRLAHAYLFRGPDGVGKQLLARILAAAVNCGSAQGLVACGSCSSCKKFAAAMHPDFELLAPEKGAIKIAQVRELIKKLSFAPYEAKMRVVLLEDVHTMRQEAANSLLKTLEEPPADNLLILTADSSTAMLQTIISRCQTIPFYPLTATETVDVILRENSDITRDVAVTLARFSEGSPGKALLLHRREILHLSQQVVDLLSDRAKTADQYVGFVLRTAEQMAALKEYLPVLLGLLRLFLRDGLVRCYSSEVDGREGEYRKDWNSDDYFVKLQAIDQAEKELKRNCNRTLVCEILLFKLQEQGNG